MSLVSSLFFLDSVVRGDGIEDMQACRWAVVLIGRRFLLPRLEYGLGWKPRAWEGTARVGSYQQRGKVT